jgi:ADP-ribose pyrophosphatase
MLVPEGPERIVFEGKIFEVVHQDMVDGKARKVFETARRSPGVRLLILDDEKILLTKERRREVEGYDYRLPGGKVFDTLAEYRAALQSGSAIMPFALAAAQKECREETGFVPTSIRHFSTSRAGGTVEWDLYYFVVDKFSRGAQDLEADEDIVPSWHSRSRVEELIAQGKMHEDRSVGVLFRFFLDRE